MASEIGIDRALDGAVADRMHVDLQAGASKSLTICLNCSLPARWAHHTNRDRDRRTAHMAHRRNALRTFEPAALWNKKRSRFALGLCTVYCLAEIADLALPPPMHEASPSRLWA